MEFLKDELFPPHLSFSKTNMSRIKIASQRWQQRSWGVCRSFNCVSSTHFDQSLPFIGRSTVKRYLSTAVEPPSPATEFNFQLKQEASELERETNLGVLAKSFSTLTSCQGTKDTSNGDILASLTLLNSQLLGSLTTISTEVESKDVMEHLGQILHASASLPLLPTLENEVLLTVQFISDYLTACVHGNNTPKVIASSPSLSSSSLSSSLSSYVNLLDDDEPEQPPACHDFKESKVIMTGADVVSFLDKLQTVTLLSPSHGDSAEYSPRVKDELLRVLATLSDRLREKDVVLTRSEVATCLYSLHGKSSNFREVRMIFGSIIGHVSTDGKEGKLWAPSYVQSCLQGMSHMDDSNNVILKGVKKMAILINLSDKSRWTFKQACECLSGLQEMSARSREVKSLLQAINKKLLRLYTTTTPEASPFSRACRAVSGLQSMDSQSNEVKQLISTLTAYIKRSQLGRESGHGDMVGECLRGLRHMNIHHSEVYTLFEVLGNKINTLSYATPEQYVSGQFNKPATFVNIIRSLSDHSSDYRATSSLFLELFGQYRSACKHSGGSALGSVDVLRALAGFKNASNRHELIHSCMQQLMGSLQHPLSQPNVGGDSGVTAYEFSNCLIGLRGMTNVDSGGNSIAVIDDALNLLTGSLERDFQSSPPNKQQMLTARNVSISLQGLQGMKCLDSNSYYGDCIQSRSTSAIVSLLDTLYDTLQHQQLHSHSSTDPSSNTLDIIHNMDLSQCSRSLYGTLHIHHNSSVKITSLKENILARINNLVEAKYGLDTETHQRDIAGVSEVLELQRVLQLYNFFYGRGGDDLFCRNVSKTCEWLTEYITQSAVIVKQNETSDNSTLERRFRKAISAEISEPSFLFRSEGDGKLCDDVSLSANTNIQGFDVDIIITFRKNGCQDFVYNLEVDGPHHKKPHKEQFLRWRDVFLSDNKHVHEIRRVCLFGDDPRRTKVINKRSRDLIVQKEIQLLLASAESFYGDSA